MERSLTFFRVFDIAFFAPGVTLVTALVISGIVPLNFKKEITTPEAIIYLLIAIAAIYTLGLVVHSLVWFIFKIFPLTKRWEKKVEKDIDEVDPKWRPLAIEFEGVVRDELILYFWYLRATCWNMAAAILLSLIIIWSVSPKLYHPNLTITGIGIICSMLLLKQGGDFHRTLKKSLKVKQALSDKQSGNSSPTSISNESGEKE